MVILNSYYKMSHGLCLPGSSLISINIYYIIFILFSTRIPYSMGSMIRWDHMKVTFILCSTRFLINIFVNLNVLLRVYVFFFLKNVLSYKFRSWEPVWISTWKILSSLYSHTLDNFLCGKLSTGKLCPSIGVDYPTISARVVMVV